MALPHSTARKVGVRVSQSHTGKLGLGQDAFSEGILGISTDAGNNQGKLRKEKKKGECMLKWICR